VRGRARGSVVGKKKKEDLTPLSGDFVHGNELYCVCRKPYNPQLFMIGCDSCNDWFHAVCVNISEEDAKKIQSYTCPNCIVAKAEQEALAKRKRPRRTAKSIDYGDDDSEEEPKGSSSRKEQNRDQEIARVFVDQDVFLQDELESSESEEKEDSMEVDAVPEESEESDLFDKWRQEVREMYLQDLEEFYSIEDELARYKQLKMKIIGCNKELLELELSRRHIQMQANASRVLSVAKDIEKFVPSVIPTGDQFVPWTCSVFCAGCFAEIPVEKYHHHLLICAEHSHEDAIIAAPRSGSFYLEDTEWAPGLLKCCGAAKFTSASGKSGSLADDFCSEFAWACAEHFQEHIEARTDIAHRFFVSSTRLQLLKKDLVDIVRDLKKE